jgi:hypothetical protein
LGQSWLVCSSANNPANPAIMKTRLMVGVTPRTANWRAPAILAASRHTRRKAEHTFDFTDGACHRPPDHVQARQAGKAGLGLGDLGGEQNAVERRKPVGSSAPRVPSPTTSR